MRIISCLAEELLTLQEGLSTMGLVAYQFSVNLCLLIQRGLIYYPDQQMHNIYIYQQYFM